MILGPYSQNFLSQICKIFLTLCLNILRFLRLKGSSINDVTALGGRGYKGFCDESTKALVIKCVTMGGGGVKNDQILRDVIYGRPQRCFLKQISIEFDVTLPTIKIIQCLFLMCNSF
jgi:hypothetical protein